MPDVMDNALAQEVERATMRRTGQGEKVDTLEQRTVGADLYSYETRLVDVTFTSGKKETYFLKDFGSSRLPKDESLRQRRERELAVYEEILAGSSLGEPDYIGKVWNKARGQFWLLLEYVPGEELSYCEFEHWVSAAAWLGRFQGYIKAHPEHLEHPTLLRHDAAFFLEKSKQAREVTAQVSDEFSKRLAPIVQTYDAATEHITAQPITLVHGAYRPHNILIRKDPYCVAPTDWESAALGTPLYDFACLADGFEGEQLEQLWGAFSAEATIRGLTLPGEREMQLHLAYVRLYRVMYWLSLTVENGDSLEHTQGIIALAEDLHERLERSVTP